uniref:helix-turn-helix domain-containing protein n=1 Tax=Actinokineospora pegani TaxID=2654637 RepID=UPI001F3FDD7F|nr:helix-turn-helix domain-containing protein [Actinokineospora pegani]
MLTLADREEVSRGLVELLEFRVIAVRIGRDPSVVSREVGRHGGREGYRAVAVEGDGGGPVGVDPVAGRLARQYRAGDPCRVSHEAIYEWVYAQPVAMLRRELIALRTGPRPAPAPRIRERHYIDERPDEVAGRAVAGHWEGDPVIGKGGKSAVATLVERTSRFDDPSPPSATSRPRPGVR